MSNSEGPSSEAVLEETCRGFEGSFFESSKVLGRNKCSFLNRVALDILAPGTFEDLGNLSDVPGSNSPTYRKVGHASFSPRRRSDSRSEFERSYKRAIGHGLVSDKASPLTACA